MVAKMKKKEELESGLARFQDSHKKYAADLDEAQKMRNDDGRAEKVANILSCNTLSNGS